MQQESLFSSQLRKYLTMGIKIWPSLRVGIRHISDITYPHQHSLLPQRPYPTMTQQQFLHTITTDMHQFIMQHDVKQEDIEDYFNDILDLLNIDEDLSLSNNNMGSVRYMSREVIKVITELQDGKTQAVEKFQNNIYNPVISMGLGEAIQQGGEEDQGVEMEDQDQEEYSDQDDDDEDEMEEEDKPEKKKPAEEDDEEEKKREKELEDDGWVIVKKK